MIEKFKTYLFKKSLASIASKGFLSIIKYRGLKSIPHR
jgi:hypothetical protein